MEKFQPGDLITYRLRGDDFGLAQVLMVEDLALHGHYHLALLDAVLKGEDGEVDSYGVAFSRRHTLDGAEQSPVVVDHIALTMSAFAESDPVKVGERPVRETDLVGYQAWVMTMRADLIRRGIIRTDEEHDPGHEEVEETEDLAAIAREVDEEELALKTSDDLIADAAGEHPGEENDGEQEDAVEQEESPVIMVELRPWHTNIYAEPLAPLLFRLHGEFVRPELKESSLGSYITSFFDERNLGALNELVSKFVEGDYSAGHELAAFGDIAADALGQYLQDDISEQLADDILNILCETDSLRAYEHVASFFAQHEGNPDDPLGLPAARGFCYAVMLTGGAPPPLQPYLDRLDDIPYTELEHDVAAAREAILNVQEQKPGEMPEASTDPFARTS